MNVGISIIDSGPDCWWTLADVLASILYTGQIPEVLRAVELVASEETIATTPITFFGDEHYVIDPQHDDIFTKVIDLRSEVKARIEREPENAVYLAALEQGLKLLANSTSYGIYVEVNEEDVTVEKKLVIVYSTTTWRASTHQIELPGTYAFTPLGALIPAGGRLLVAIAEKLAADRGLSYAHIDTDGITFTRPEGMNREEFWRLEQEVADWFDPLSPYAAHPPILELEKQNLWHGQREPLYFLGVSDKRYAIYNLCEATNGPIAREGTCWDVRIRKFSSHGQGTYARLKDYVPPSHIPDPCETTKKTGEPDSYKLGGQRWSYDLWYEAIVAFETDMVHGQPLPRVNGEPLYYLNTTSPWLQKPAFLQTTLSTWDLFAAFSRDELGSLDVRPFSFFSVLPGFHGVSPSQRGSLSHRKLEAFTDGDDRGLYDALPSDTTFNGPYVSSSAELDEAIAAGTFGWNDQDGTRHMLLPGTRTKTIAEAYERYFQHPEYKSGNPTGCGDLPVRHVTLGSLAVCGKEGNASAVDLAEDTDGELGGIDDVQVYGIEPVDLSEYRLSDLVLVCGLPRKTLSCIRTGRQEPKPDTARRIAQGVQLLNPYNSSGIAGWREIDDAVLATAMSADWTEQDIQRIRNGQRILTAEERERFITAIQWILSRCRKEKEG
jgi:hypothetical protein